MDIVNPSLPADDSASADPDGSPPAGDDATGAPLASARRRRWPWVVGVFAVLGLAAAFVIPTPYYLFEPGSVRPTEERIEIDGHRSFTTRGAVLFTTVGIEHATVSDLVRGWLDDAIEIESVEDVYPQGEAREEVINQQLMDNSKLAAIAVAFRTVGYPATPTGTGAFVNAVMEDFPDARRVLRQGDVITSVDGSPVRVSDDLSKILGSRPIGDEVRLEVVGGRSKERRDVTLRLGRNDDDPSRGYLGIQVSTAGQDLELPFDVEIDSGKVTGPSAGLAWTLGLIDRLTPGSLTGGREVAVTGTISLDGSVGPIGGIAQKMATLKRAGVKVFLYPKDTPRDEVRAIERLAEGEVELHAVATIDDAIRVLAPDGLPAAPPLG